MITRLSFVVAVFAGILPGTIHSMNPLALVYRAMEQQTARILAAQNKRQRPESKSLLVQGVFIRAVLQGRVSNLQKVLNDPGIDLNVLWLGRPLLFYAVRNNDYEVVEKLLAHEHFDPNLQDGKWGNTALHWLVLWEIACSRTDYIEMIQLLLSSPRIRTDIPNKDGQTVGGLIAHAQRDACLDAILEAQKSVFLL